MANKSRCMELIIKEVTQIKLHAENMNNKGFSLRPWKPLNQILKE
jgi:hypothetical protein